MSEGMAPVHPGEVLLETLQEKGMTQTELARRTGLTLKHINMIIHGRSGIGLDAAIRFQRVLGVSAGMWLGLQANYRTDVLRERERASETAAV